MIIKNLSEKKFSNYLDKQGYIYIYQPKLNMPELSNYVPDFYCFDTDYFYEVIGTRQAYHQNKERLYQIQKIIKLIIVDPNGNLYRNYSCIDGSILKNERNKWIKKQIKIRYFNMTSFDFENFLKDKKITPGEFLKITQQKNYSIFKRGTMKLKYIKILEEKYEDLSKYINKKED